MMRDWWLSTAVMSLFLTACGGDDLFVESAVAPVPGECRLDSPSARRLERATLDVALSFEYIATLRVGTDDDDGVVVRGAVVQLKTQDGAVLVEEQDVSAWDRVSPGPSGATGHSTVEVALIPADVGSHFAAVVTDRGAEPIRVIADYYLFGVTASGSDVEGEHTSLAIDVCHGCLVAFPKEALDGASKCTQAADSAPEPPCRMGQDDAVDCRLCVATHPVCGGL